MSRRNRFKLEGKPNFVEVPPKKGENKIAAAPMFKPSVSSSVMIDVEEKNDEKVSFFGKVLSFLTSAGSATWGWCAGIALWFLGGLRKIPSYCVLRWAEEDETNIASEKTKAEFVSKESVPSKTSANKPHTLSTVDFDEDELPISRWWGLGIKAVAALVAAGVLVGGYFVAQPMLSGVFAPSSNVAVADVDEVGVDGVDADKQEGISELAAVGTAESGTDEFGTAGFAVEAGHPESRASARNSADVSLPVQSTGEPAVGSTPPIESAFDSAFEGASSIFLPAFSAESAFPVAEVRDVQEPAASVTSSTATPNVAAAPDARAPAAPLEPSSLSNMQPLTPLASNNVASSSVSNHAGAALPDNSLLANSQTNLRLQPLTPLIASSTPPMAAESSVAAPVASVYAPPVANARQAPTSPDVNVLPQAKAMPPIVLIESIKEIIPQIPSSGNIQNVPPPAPAFVAEMTAQNMSDSSETAPAIPQDTPLVDSSTLVVSVPIIPASAVATHQTNLPDAEGEVGGRIVPMESQAMDWQLWEHIRSTESESVGSVAPAPQLRFVSRQASEPALRFAPRDEANNIPTNNAPNNNVPNDTFLEESLSEFSGLMPAEGFSQVEATVESAASSAPVFVAPNATPSVAVNKAPMPAVAVALPAYRNDGSGNETDTDTSEQAMENQGSVTFPRWVDSETTRSPSETQFYTVRQGDTYITISDRFYGTSLLYPALAEHNQRLGTGWHLSEGMSVEIPTAEFLRLNYRTASNQQERRLNVQRPAVQYIVQEGDTIFRLATDKLNDSSRWREIYALNSDRLTDIRDLKPGMEILLPVETARQSSQRML